MPPIMASYSARETRWRDSNVRSWCWPSQRIDAGFVEDACGGEHAVGRDARLFEVEEGALGEDEHAVAGVDGERDADALPEGLAAVAGLAGVLDVVVDEGEVVQEFDRGSGGEGALHRRSDGLAGEEAEGGAQHLAADVYAVVKAEVVSHEGDVFDAGAVEGGAHGVDDGLAVAGEDVVDGSGCCHCTSPPGPLSTTWRGGD